MARIRGRDEGGARVIDWVLEELRLELGRAGVSGRSAGRPLAEARDHLLEAVQADGEEAAAGAFGPPTLVARRIAAEIASRRTCGAAFSSFAALAAAAVVYLLVTGLAGLAGSTPDVASGRTAVLGIAATVGCALLPQIAFVAGCLAVGQAWRLRRRTAVAAELELLRRRSAVALCAGAVSMLALVLYAIEFGRELAGWWMPAAVALCAASAVPLALAAVRLRGSAKVAGLAGGPAGDVFDDLCTLLDRVPALQAERLRAHPALFVTGMTALICASAVAVRWQAEGDPGSGLVAGAFETVAFLACYFALRRPLGLGGLRAKAGSPA